MFRAYAPFLINLSKETTEMPGCPSAVAAATVFPQTPVLGAVSCAIEIVARAIPSVTTVIKLGPVLSGRLLRVVTNPTRHAPVNVTATRQGRVSR